MNLPDPLRKDRAALLQALQDAGAKVNGNMGSVRCPFHEDKTGSMSVFDGEDGACLWRCHACDLHGDIYDVVAKAKGIELKAAFHVARETYGNGSSATPAPKAKCERRRFATVEAAVEAYERQSGKSCTARYEYRDADGHVALIVLRLEGDGGKTFRPIRPEGGAWIEGKPDGPTPLYGLPSLLGSDKGETVVIVEGEKTADALRELGVVTVTSCGGSQAAGKSDWTPLSGRHVVVWPDCDDAGQKYRVAVESILCGLDRPPATLRNIDPGALGLPDGGDAVDMIGRIREDADDNAARARVEELLASAADSPRQSQCGLDFDAAKVGTLCRAPSTFEPVRMVKTGWARLDEALGGGLAEGEVSVLFGTTSTGKSSCMLNMVRNICAAEIPCAVFSLEMLKKPIAQLALSIEGDVSRPALRCGNLSADESERLAAAIERVERWPLHIFDRQSFAPKSDPPEAPDMARIGAAVREGARVHGWRITFVDYLAKVGPFGESDLERLPKLASWAVDLAQRTGVHIVALAQANKASWGRKDEKEGTRDIRLEDMKGSIEGAADVDNVIGLVRDDWGDGEPVDPSPMRAKLLKARYGACGTVHLSFRKSTGRIEEVSDPGDAKAAEETAIGAACMRTFVRDVPDREGTIIERAMFDRHLKLSMARAKRLLTASVDGGLVYALRIGKEDYFCALKEALEKFRFEKETGK